LENSTPALMTTKGKLRSHSLQFTITVQVIEEKKPQRFSREIANLQSQTK